MKTLISLAATMSRWNGNSKKFQNRQNRSRRNENRSRRNGSDSMSYTQIGITPMTSTSSLQCCGTTGLLIPTKLHIYLLQFKQGNVPAVLGIYLGFAKRKVNISAMIGALKYTGSYVDGPDWDLNDWLDRPSQFNGCLHSTVTCCKSLYNIITSASLKLWQFYMV